MPVVDCVEGEKNDYGARLGDRGWILEDGPLEMSEITRDQRVSQEDGDYTNE